MKLDILAITAHPDDVELTCAGTLLKQIDLGYAVGLVDLTAGELGTRGNGALRIKEAQEAADKMGAKVRENLGMPDTFFRQSRENIKAIARVIRKYQPKIIITNTIEDRHPDHGRAAKLVSDAIFVSGLVKVQTYDDAGLLQDRWRPEAVYHGIQDRYLKPDFVVDVTNYWERKMELVMTFRSQFYDPGSDELSSPISSKEFLNFLEGRAREFGRPAGYELAEGFIVQRTIGVKNLFDIE